MRSNLWFKPWFKLVIFTGCLDRYIICICNCCACKNAVEACRADVKVKVAESSKNLVKNAVGIAEETAEKAFVNYETNNFVSIFACFVAVSIKNGSILNLTHDFGIAVCVKNYGLVLVTLSDIELESFFCTVTVNIFKCSVCSTFVCLDSCTWSVLSLCGNTITEHKVHNNVNKLITDNCISNNCFESYVVKLFFSNSLFSLFNNCVKAKVTYYVNTKKSILKCKEECGNKLSNCFVNICYCKVCLSNKLC